jgi:hypothetical protein
MDGSVQNFSFKENLCLSMYLCHPIYTQLSIYLSTYLSIHLSDKNIKCWPKKARKLLLWILGHCNSCLPYKDMENKDSGASL